MCAAVNQSEIGIHIRGILKYVNSKDMGQMV